MPSDGETHVPNPKKQRTEKKEDSKEDIITSCSTETSLGSLPSTPDADLETHSSSATQHDPE